MQKEKCSFISMKQLKTVKISKEVHKKLKEHVAAFEEKNITSLMDRIIIAYIRRKEMNKN
jgi:hypothetical protein